ncbi:hypothetical protein MMC14_005500 [Varicellaria rhodocarpa]|nr:hypothetical protein [Varicellaria rhodocarpa]
MFIRCGPNRLSINSSSALQAVYNVNANVQKSNVYDSFKYFFGSVDMSMTTIDKKNYAFKRRINVMALNSRAIKEMEETMLKNIRYFSSTIANDRSPDWTSGHDMSNYIGYLVSDIMGDITFSRNWDVQKQHTNRHLAEELPRGVAGIHLTGHMP